MKLTVLQENLAKAINQASRFANPRAQLPILGNVLLKASNTKLTISSTNLEISILNEVGAKIDEGGEISIPAKIISELVGNLPKDQIKLESEKEQLKVSASGFTSKILGMDATDFPKIPSSLVNPAVIQKEKIHESLSKVVFAVSSDETRPVLTGVLIIFSKGFLSFVATDGFRLSQKKTAFDESKKVDGNQKIIIPKGIVNELLRSLEDVGDVQLEIRDKEKQIVFGLGETILSSRLLEGEFPDFEKIIPASSSISVKTDKEDLLRAVKLASIFARESSNIVKLKLKTDSVVVSAESGSAGSQETDVEAKITGEAKDFEIAFNYRFLEEFLHSVIGEEVEMKFNTPDKAGVFLDSSDTDYLHLIMPVKVQG